MRIASRALRAHRLTVVAVCCALGAGSAFAETSGEVGIRLSHTDNVDLVEDNERSDLIRSPYIRFGWNSDSPLLTATVDGNLQYLDFRDDTSNDDTIGELSAVGDMHLIRDRLDLHVEDRYQQVRFNELDPLAPDNTANANTLIIGPDLRFDPSSVDRVTLGARYGDTYFERGTDSERWAYGAVWSHRLSTINELAINVQRQEVNFTEEDPEAIDYTLDEVGIGWTHRLARGSVTLTGGGRTVDRDSGDTLERGFARLDWQYTPTRRTEFDLRAESGLTDSGVQLIGRNRPTVELPNGDAFVSNDIATLSEVQARLLRRGARLDVTLGVRGVDEDFDTSDLDRSSWGASLGFVYALTVRDRLEWSIRGESTDYDLLDRTDDDLTGEVLLRHLLSRNVFVEGGVGYWNRDSTAADSSFEENRAFVAAGYSWGD